jgi:purine-binding chemotaxis protein CheW
MTTAVEAQGQLLQFVTFQLGDEEFAVNVAQVQEIVRLTTITAVPRAPHYVEGVLNLRGRIVPVIDLAKRFGLPPHERTKTTRVVITEVEGRTVGMLVDAVTEVIRLAAGAIEPTPEALKDGLNADYITGIGKVDERLLIMLDLPRVLSHQEGAALAALEHGA